MRQFDLREIDSVPPSFWTRRYRGRLDRVIETIRQRLPVGSLILDIACAQGNAAILLGELGYRVVAVDLRKAFLAYGRKKDDRGVVRWVVGDGMEPPFARECADGVVLGEVLEHVAHPGRLVERGLELVRPGGLVICTTPNGAGLRDRRLPSYRAARRRPWELEARQFGPEGADHLFALRPGEMVCLAPPNVRYSLQFGVSTLWNRSSSWLARSHVASSMLEAVSQLPPWRRWLCETLILVLEKGAT